MPDSTTGLPSSRILTIVLSVVYAALLVGVILFKFPFNYDLTENGREVNLIPFAGSFSSRRFGLSEVVENVLIFAPLGLYLSMLFRWPPRRRILLVAGVSVVFEAIQYACGIGRSDITDVIENTAGGLVGIGVYLLARRALATRAHTVLNFVAIVITVLAIAFFAYLRVHSK